MSDKETCTLYASIIILLCQEMSDPTTAMSYYLYEQVLNLGLIN
jgi:hypothetical protein